MNIYVNLRIFINNCAAHELEIKVLPVVAAVSIWAIGMNGADQQVARIVLAVIVAAAGAGFGPALIPGVERLWRVAGWLFAGGPADAILDLKPFDNAAS